jgi:mannose-6-phosphate isomerase-like protein (cupin superfamily)
MPRPSPRPRRSTVFWIALTLSLTIGWAFRELAHARQRAAILASQTLNLDQLKMSTYEDRGNPVGQMGLYVQGETPGCSSLVTGRFIVDPGKSPHPPHVHDDEEVLIVGSGHGEIICDGKTTKVGPGSMMYSTPNVAHGLNNTGQEPLTFYFVKWTPRASTQAR